MDEKYRALLRQTADVVQTKIGSERETVTPADGMGVLIFGDSG
jgi:hypothetical protein